MAEPFSQAEIIAAATIAKWRRNPYSFVTEELGATPDPWQADVLRALPNNMRLALKACKGPGKTCLLAWIAWWFLVCFSHPKIAATSITGDNLKDGLWAEMSKWQQKSEFLKDNFVWTATRIYYALSPETWFMSARQWAKSATPDAQADTLAGLHADNIMFILDEVGGTPDGVMAAAEAALSNAGSAANPNAVAYLIMAGNPTHLAGPLYRACTSEARLWHITEITGDPDNPKRSPRINIEWARQQIDKYGADSPWVMVNVFGRFPPSSINALLGPDEVSAAMARSYQPHELVEQAIIIGADISGFGDDKTVIFPRHGVQATRPRDMVKQTGQVIASHIAKMFKDIGADGVFVDGTGGWGQSTCENLTTLGVPHMPIMFSAKAPEVGFYNMRSYMAWKMAEAIKANLAIPDMPELREELCALEYTFKDDKIILIDKELVKQRLHGRSPDYSDALMLTFAYPVMKGQNTQQPDRGRNYNPVDEFVQDERSGGRDDYDPFKDFRR